ncbi:MAG: uracil-DNA glycosylase [Simkaniaceae bacterium]|nr:uracil-DNA glycosylase [Simkaniaceae bacterium]
MKIAKDWAVVLREEWRKEYLHGLKRFLREEKERNAVIYPEEPFVFEAFRHTRFVDVKVVIMGQDPYHGPGQAHGLSFSVRRGVPPPPSLRNIYRELQSDLKVDPAPHGNLERWAGQGVLLLNATLTVRAGSPRSHYGKGWESFTDAVIRILVQRDDPVIFLLWGRAAQEKCEAVLRTRDHPHVVLQAAHPSPYSATRFFGCRHFSQVNKHLQKWGREPINWSLL